MSSTTNEVELGNIPKTARGHRRTNSDIGVNHYRKLNNETSNFVRSHRRTQSNISQNSVNSIHSQGSICSDQSLLGLGRYARLINEEETASWTSESNFSTCYIKAAVPHLIWNTKDCILLK